MNKNDMQHPLHLFRHCPKCGSTEFGINDFKSKKCAACGFVYYFNPLAATVGIITDGKGRILVARRAKEPAMGTLDLPGGFCDSYETAEEGVAREILEETGLKVTGTRYLFSIPNLYVYSGMELHTMDLFFLCEVEDNSHLTADDDVDNLQWIEIEKLDSKEFGLQSIRKSIEIFKEMHNNNRL
jgi:mutator protein MutT